MCAVEGHVETDAVKTDKISKLGVYTLQIGLEDRFHKGQDNRTNIPKPLSQRVSQEMLLQRTTQTTPKPTCTHNNEPSLYNLSLYRQMATAPANDESFTCGVCLDIFVDPCTMTPCGHSACKRCLCLWLDHQHGTALCPICTGYLTCCAFFAQSSEHLMGIELQLAEVSWELQMRGQRISTALQAEHVAGSFVRELPLLALGGIVLSLAIGAWSVWVMGHLQHNRIETR